jgi:hypothetical protein
MLKLVIALSLVLSASASMAGLTCDQKDLKRAQNLYDQADEQIKNGALAPIGLQIADFNLFEAKHCSGADKLDVRTYCETKVTKLLEIEAVQSKRFGLGVTTIETLIDAQSKIRDAKTECGLIEMNGGTSKSK